MKRWLWFLAAVLISTVVYATIRYGLRPKPIPVMNATQFEDPQQIGAVVYRRLRQNVRPERLIVLGSSADVARYEQVWLGFLKTAAADQVKIAVLFQHESLTPIEGWETVKFSDATVASGELAKQIQAREAPGRLIVVIAPSEQVTHLMKDSISRRLEEAVRHPVLSLSTLAVPKTPEEIAAMNESCLRPDSDTDGNLRLVCARAHVGKTLAKKRSQEGKIWAVMERHGLQEYLVFTSN